MDLGPLIILFAPDSTIPILWMKIPQLILFGI